MPKGLLKIDNVELNYVSAKRGNTLFIAFMNQSPESVVSGVRLNSLLVGNISGGEVKIVSGKNATKLVDGEFKVTVAAHGLTAVKIEGAEIKPSFQDMINAQKEVVENSFINIDFGNAKAMLFNVGNLNKRVYIYLQDTDATFKNVTLNYLNAEGREVSITKNNYPFEFTIPLERTQNGLSFSLFGIKTNGQKLKSKQHIVGAI
jgi:hypothetical protein